MKNFLTLQSSSFTYLNVTQFLGALNDNIFKLLIAYFCIDILGDEHSTRILATAGAIFVIPFLLFSSTSGQLADRYSKRNIIFICKCFELVTMLLGVVALTMQVTWGAYVILFLMATQSALFGPSKYGIIPELVETERISRANGLVTSMTFLAIIIGTFLASFITDITGRNFILAGIICSSISLAGLFTAWAIEKTPPSGSKHKINPWFLIEIYKTTKEIRKQPTLLVAVLGSAYFLFAGAFIQLNIIPFAMQNLGLTDVQGGYLFLLTALGIGTGSMIAGRLSGKVVELGLVPLGGMGMIAGCFLMDYWSERLELVIPLVIIIGVLGGIYLIPLDAYIQVASPNKTRGQVVATTNFFGFLGVLFASAALYVISEILGLRADKGFMLLGILTALMTLVVTYQVYDFLSRYIAMVVAKLHFKLTVRGQEQVPFGKPAIYLCSHTAWNDTLLLLSSQHLPVRFFAARLHEHSRFLRRLYRMLRIVLIPSIELTEDDQEQMKQIRDALKRGISVCLFLDEDCTPEEYARIKQSFEGFVDGTAYPLLTVDITVGEPKPRSDKLQELLKKIRVPASVTFAPA